MYIEVSGQLWYHQLVFMTDFLLKTVTHKSLPSSGSSLFGDEVMSKRFWEVSTHTTFSQSLIYDPAVCGSACWYNTMEMRLNTNEKKKENYSFKWTKIDKTLYTTLHTSKSLAYILKINPNQLSCSDVPHPELGPHWPPVSPLTIYTHRDLNDTATSKNKLQELLLLKHTNQHMTEA